LRGWPVTAQKKNQCLCELLPVCPPPELFGAEKCGALGAENFCALGAEDFAAENFGAEYFGAEYFCSE
jgi:hypothetical protein